MIRAYFLLVILSLILTVIVVYFCVPSEPAQLIADGPSIEGFRAVALTKAPGISPMSKIGFDGVIVALVAIWTVPFIMLFAVARWLKFQGIIKRRVR